MLDRPPPLPHACPRPAGKRGRVRGAVGAPAMQILLFVALFVALLAGGLLPSPRPAAGQGVPEALPDRPTAYLVTVGPGEAVWERFGHNLIWIHDPSSGAEEGYNYGLFSFEQENFLLRFIQGQMRYWMQGFSVQRQLSGYRSQNRSIRIQELALAPPEVRELHDFLEWNERPENRFYAYDYYRDNCSTRVRDALDRILDGRLGSWARARPTEASYRDHTLRQTHGLFWVSVGMHFGLGPTVDEPLTAWQAMFIPMELEEHLRDFTVEGEDGTRVPLIRSEWTYFQADRPATPDTTPRWLGLFAAVGLGMAGAFLALGRAIGPASVPEGGGADASSSRARTGFLVLATAWLVGIGLLGLLIGLLWAFTDHWGTRWNLNLWHATPLHLALAALLWPLFRARPWAAPVARWTAAAVAALTGVGLAVQALPGPGQVNAEYLLLLVPTNLALAWSVWRAADPRPRPRPGAA